MTICKLEKITKKYKDRVVLDEIDLEINAGEFVAITGKSGTGKSTLLNIIGMIDEADSGVLSLFGQPFNKKKRLLYLRNKIAYIFQNFALIENETIKQNLDIALAYSGKNRKEKENLMHMALREVGLEDTPLSQHIYSLSGGEQQRVALARALLKPSELILADEPTGSLDIENRDIVMTIIKKLNEQGKTIIMVTHDQEVASFCDRVISL